MLRLLRKTVVAVLAASVFIVTTLAGLVAGFIGVLIRAQLPDPTLTEAASQDASREAASAVTFVSHSTRPPTELHQPDGIA